MIFTLLAKTAGYICYYGMYWSGRAVYSMLTADPAAIALVALL